MHNNRIYIHVTQGRFFLTWLRRHYGFQRDCRQNIWFANQGLIMIYCEYLSLNLRDSLRFEKINQVEQLNTKSWLTF